MHIQAEVMHKWCGWKTADNLCLDRWCLLTSEHVCSDPVRVFRCASALHANCSKLPSGCKSTSRKNQNQNPIPGPHLVPLGEKTNRSQNAVSKPWGELVHVVVKDYFRSHLTLIHIHKAVFRSRKINHGQIECKKNKNAVYGIAWLLATRFKQMTNHFKNLLTSPLFCRWFSASVTQKS